MMNPTISTTATEEHRSGRRRFGRVIRLALVPLVALGGLTALTASDAAGDVVQQPFYSQGIVADASAPVDPTSVEFDRAFQQNPITDASGSAMSYVTPDGLKIYTTPLTAYHRQVPGGNYQASTYEATVVEGEAVRVAGKRITEEDGTVRFVATAISNPPYVASGTGGGPPPSCGVGTPLVATRKFAVVATITRLQGRVACTGFGGYIGAFQVSDPVPPYRFGIGLAFEAFNNKLDIQVLPTTQYRKGREPSTWNEIIKIRNQVYVIGQYIQVGKGWIFAANSVTAPAPGKPLFTTVDTHATVIQQSPGHYEGPTTGPNFQNGTMVTDIAWSPTAHGWVGQGTFVLTNVDGINVLRGTVDGNTVGLAIDFDLTITSGEGQFFGATGAGFWEGTWTGAAGPPSALDGRVVLRAILP